LKFQEQSLGNWQLVRKVQGEVKTSFKFHRTLKIEAGGTVTVWSFNVEGATHEPPHNIVMKNQKFGSGDEISTILLNTDGEVRVYFPILMNLFNLDILCKYYFT
jgi:Intermediate filament tail domain.